MKSFDSALDQPIENMGRQGFGLNPKSHVARGAASGSTMVNTMVRANFRLSFFGERTHGLAIDRTICIHLCIHYFRTTFCLNPAGIALLCNPTCNPTSSNNKNRKCKEKMTSLRTQVLRGTSCRILP
jgi:hypothetical protein